MTASDNVYTLIMNHEGCNGNAYQCPAGKWTIGFGHTEGVKPGMKITFEEAMAFLKEDVAKCEDCLNRLDLNLSQNQFDALIDFIFNVGTGNFLSSTLLKKVKVNPDDKSIATELRRWVYSKGKVLSGLVARRSAEVKLYFS